MFLYFFPEATTEQLADRLRATGVDRVLADLCATPADAAKRLAHHASFTGVPRPDGSLSAGGLLVAAWHPEGGECLLKPDRQIWRWIPADGDAPEYAIGVWKDRLPSELTLRRDEVLPGAAVALGEPAVAWSIPIARYCPDAGSTGNPTGLPLRYEWIGGLRSGSAQTFITERWLWLWALSQHIWDWWFIRNPVDVSTRYRWAAEVLSANYRVGPIECGILGLFTTETVDELLASTIDAHKFAEFLETEDARAWLAERGIVRTTVPNSSSPDGSTAPPPGLNSSPGPVDDLPDTVPAGPTSV